MNEIELFFATWEKTAWAFFSFTGFIYALYRAYQYHKNNIKHEAREEQRKEFQAEFFDRNHDDFKELQNKYENLLVEVTILKNQS